LEEQFSIPHLREVVVFLVVAGVIVPLFHRARFSVVLGFLVVGMLIGPYGLGLFASEIGLLRYAVIEDIEGVRKLAELGVVFLMFTIGLELSIDRLWSLRRLVFGLGLLQVVVTTVIVGLIAWMVGTPGRNAMIIGMCLALSSTAIVMQTLTERHELASPLGQTCFSILFMQDLAVVPVLFILAVLGGESQSSLSLAIGAAFGKALLALVLIFVVGRSVLRPLLRLVARTRTSDLFTAVTLLVVIATAWVTSAAGLSAALGAFLAGLLIAESEFRHEVEVDIEPFKGLLVGLFFMSVGMLIDLRIVADSPIGIVAVIVGLFVVKALIIAGLATVFGVARATALEAGLLLGQAGEFALVVVSFAMAGALVTRETGQFVLIVTATTMLATPLVAALGRRLAAEVAGRERPGHRGAHEPAAAQSGHVVIAGFGRVGQLLARILEAQGESYVALDLDGHAVSQCRAQGLPVFYGDARRTEILRKVHVDGGRALVVTMDDPRAVQHAVQVARKQWPHLPVYARARDSAHAQRLLHHGATDVVPESLEAGLQLAARVLEGLGAPIDAVALAIDRERELELQKLR